jgi:hypothetical protein
MPGMLRRVVLRSLSRLVVIASVLSSSPILVSLMKEVLHFSEATRRNIPEDETLYIELGMYIMALSPSQRPINPSHQTFYLCMPPIVAREQFDSHLPR